tara:strand:+ start:23 stop:331 length:309 start_codon:yes stop_codon:yes gene_type:complete
MELLKKIQLFQEVKEFYNIDEQSIIIKGFLNEANENTNLQKREQSNFIKEYFKELSRKENGIPVHRNNHECFNYLNQKYFKLFGKEKYTNYDSFRKSYNGNF